MTEPGSPTEPAATTSTRPSGVMGILLWIALALDLYGIAAVFGLGGLEEAVEEIPGTGFVGGLFVGLALFAVPVFAARALGRELPITPVYPGSARVLVAVGLVGMAIIGLIAVLVDVGFLNIVAVPDQ